MRILIALLLTLIPAVAKKQIDLVQHGKEVFHTVGCAECHSETKDDPSVKTGPNLYALFQKSPRKTDVLAGGEKHRQSINADLKYLTQSLRNPAADLAIASSGPTKGQPYLPVMPPYDKAFLSDFKVKAIHQYLLTLNQEKNRGPAQLLAEDKSGATLRPALQDPNEILVTNRTRIYRTRIPGQSSRAVYVGTPSGLNYAFEPTTLSIERIWWGGFINIAGSLDGRGQKPSRLGHNALEIELKTPLLAPLHPTTKQPIDLSFKSPRMRDFTTIAKNLHGDPDFATQLKQADATFLGYQHNQIPTFHYRVGKNIIHLQLTVTPDGQATILITGILATPQTFRLNPIIKDQPQDLTITELPKLINFTLPVKPAWRPTTATAIAKTQALKSTPPKNLHLPQGLTAQQIAAPLDPHGRPQLFEPLGMDLAPDNSLIIASRTAGIWKLKDNQWTQIAEGLQDALGIIIEDDGSLIVGQKPELTRLSDIDGDGWFDHYQTLSEDFLSSSNYHEYLHGPAKGTDGNYYLTLNLTHHNSKDAIYKAGGPYMGAQGGYRGWALQVTPNGKTTPFASGLRSPAGLTTGPDGQLYYTENQGEYVGTSKLFHLQKDKFYGHPSGLVDLPRMTPSSPEIQWDQVKEAKEKALALMPHSRIANAPGSPTWSPPHSPLFPGHIFVGDQTLSTLFRILPKPNNEAAVIPFAHGFPSGLMRLQFDKNGHLYVGQTGRGWRAKGGSEHALILIQKTDQPLPNQLADITRSANTLTLHFTQPIPETPDPSQLAINSWTYLDSPKYGSPENDKTTHQITSLQPGAKPNTLELTLDTIPQDNKNRVLQLTSKTLPPTKADTCEAYFTITRD